MTMSTCKSLGGPVGGLIISNYTEIAKRMDAIAFPRMTAKFDASKSSAVAITMLDWRDFGAAYAAEMIVLSNALAAALDDTGLPVFSGTDGFTKPHQFAVCAETFGGGQIASKTLHNEGFLACGIELPIATLDSDMNELRIGTRELVR